MSVISSLVVCVFLYQAWSVWKDRHDHAEYLYWREQWAEELKLIRDWRERKMKASAREQELEQMRLESGEELSSWDHQDEIAKMARNITHQNKAKT